MQQQRDHRHNQNTELITHTRGPKRAYSCCNQRYLREGVDTNIILHPKNNLVRLGESPLGHLGVLAPENVVATVGEV